MSHKWGLLTEGEGGWGTLFAAWFIIFLTLVVVSYGLGLAPRHIRSAGDALMVWLIEGRPIEEPPLNGARYQPTGTAEELPAAQDTSARVIITKVGIDTPLVFPPQSDFETLNASLANGAVHYPSSALPGEAGNVFIFGHSTGLPVIRNPAYAAFNGVKNLKAGDTIRLRYANREYWYTVRTLSIEKADDAKIDLSTNERILTISTCNVIGAKEDRFVVEAVFAASYPLRNRDSAPGTSL